MRFLVPKPADLFGFWPTDLWNEMDELFARAFQFPRFVPPVDIEETDDAYIVTAEVPGFDKKDIEVELLNNVLVIRGEKIEEPGRRFLHRERLSSATRFERRIQLPGQVEHDRVNAKFNNGELVITLPKASGQRGWRIPLN